jgi:ADP-ribose pyrophosphatase
MKKTASLPSLEYSNPFMDIRKTSADFGSFRKNYFVVDLGPRAGIVAVKDGRVLLTRQYRFLIDRDSWEIPGGRVDAGETPDVAAVRECFEETGVRCHDLNPLVMYYPGLDNFDNRTTLFHSSNLDLAAPFVPDPAEVMEVAWIDLGECLERVYRGEILDALTVTGLLAYQARVVKP